MATSNDEIMAELREVRRTVEELHSRPSIGTLVFRLLDPKVLVSIGFLLAVGGILVGRALTIEGFGLSISTAAEKTNAELAAEAADSTAASLVRPTPEPVLRALELREDRDFDTEDEPPPATSDTGHD